MPGGAAAAAAETSVPKDKYERGQKSRPARGGGSKQQTASGERDVSPTATSTSSWTRCGGRTISEWMAADRKDTRLDWKRAVTADEKDDRYLGEPCLGDHNTTNPLARHANQYKVSYKCVNCKLVMLYIPRHVATGEYRKAGPLGKTVSKIDIEEITKERRPKPAPKKEHSQPPVPELSESDHSGTGCSSGCFSFVDARGRLSFVISSMSILLTVFPSGPFERYLPDAPCLGM